MELDPLDITGPATSHPTPEMLESYALGHLSEPQLARLETHLFVCHSCQDALAETDDYVAAMKAALAEPIPELVPSRWATLTSRFLDQLRYPQAVPALSCAIAAFSLAILLSQNPAAEAQVAEVTLRSVRGATASLAAEGPARTRLDMKIQSQYLRVDQSFQVRIVDAVGKSVWFGVPQFSNENGHVLHVNAPLDEGSYWVRLYDAHQQLLQEYGLRLK